MQSCLGPCATLLYRGFSNENKKKKIKISVCMYESPRGFAKHAGVS